MTTETEIQFSLDERVMIAFKCILTLKDSLEVIGGIRRDKLAEISKEVYKQCNRDNPHKLSSVKDLKPFFDNIKKGNAPSEDIEFITKLIYEHTISDESPKNLRRKMCDAIRLSVLDELSYVNNTPIHKLYDNMNMNTQKYNTSKYKIAFAIADSTVKILIPSVFLKTSDYNLPSDERMKEILSLIIMHERKIEKEELVRKEKEEREREEREREAQQILGSALKNVEKRQSPITSLNLKEEFKPIKRRRKPKTIDDKVDDKENNQDSNQNGNDYIKLYKGKTVVIVGEHEKHTKVRKLREYLDEKGITNKYLPANCDSKKIVSLPNGDLYVVLVPGHLLRVVKSYTNMPVIHFINRTGKIDDFFRSISERLK